MKRFFSSLLLAGFFLVEANAFAWTTTLKPPKIVQLSYRTGVRASSQKVKHPGRKHRKKKAAQKVDDPQSSASKQ